MRSPRGFGKRYFSLAAITAYAAAVREARRTSRFEPRRRKSPRDRERSEEPPPEESPLSVFLRPRPCHCNRIFQQRTRLTLRLNTYIPRCPFYTTYFAFRRTGVHPPVSF
ncbi:hypothetical protein [Nitratifractor sp.]